MKKIWWASVSAFAIVAAIIVVRGILNSSFGPAGAKSVTTVGDKTFTVIGGNDQSINSVANGSEIVVDGHVILITKTSVSVNGTPLNPPPFTEMEIHINGEAAFITLDGDSWGDGFPRQPRQQSESLSTGDQSAFGGIQAVSQNLSDTPPAATADALRLKRFDIIDQDGFGNPIEAVSFLAPTDWQVEGSVTWNPGATCPADLATVHVRVGTADRSTFFEIVPPLMLQWHDGEMQRSLLSGRCPLGAPMDAATFIAN